MPHPSKPLKLNLMADIDDKGLQGYQITEYYYEKYKTHLFCKESLNRITKEKL